MIKNADLDHYFYLDMVLNLIHLSFSLFDGSRFGRNVIIFGAHLSSSVHMDKKKKDILIFGKIQAYGLDDSTLTSEKE